MDSVTTIVVTYERLAATRRCLEALQSRMPPGPLFIVDNASRAEVQNDLRHRTAHFVARPRNDGLYRALNEAIERAETEIIAFLDCDIVVQDGWWQALHADLTAAPDIGLAGSRYLNADGSLQEGFPRLRDDGWYGENHRDLQESADCEYIAIGCSLFRKSAWARVGGFDDHYFISHGDVDFCYRLRYRGSYRIRYCPASSVVHDHDYGREPAYERVRFDSMTCTSDHTRFQTIWGAAVREERRDDVATLPR